MKLANMKVLITGGLGLLGSAIVQEIERHGGLPVATSRDPKKVNQFNTEAKASLKQARAVYLGFDNEAELYSSLAETTKSYGPFDGLVNNAFCRAPWKSVESTFWSDWTKQMQVNVFAPHTISTELAKLGRLSAVVNVSSMYGVIAPDFNMYRDEEYPNPITYGTTKAALLAITRYLAAYWGSRGIRVNAVSPGGIFNEQNEDFLKRYDSTIPMSRMVTKEEVAATIGFLLSEDSSGITGQNILVDGGRTIW
jgi:NAD(P)-dependent dehydrogenase (short-subunit alcohol dehydrogenase family)